MKNQIILSFCFTGEAYEGLKELRRLRQSIYGGKRVSISELIRLSLRFYHFGLRDIVQNKEYCLAKKNEDGTLEEVKLEL